jgi:hypothetical protein
MPNQLFERYDGHKGRQFEAWELEVMFDLASDDAAHLVDNLCNRGRQGQPVHIKPLFELLRNHVQGEMIYDNLPRSSVFKSRVTSNPQRPEKLNHVADYFLNL